MLRSTRVDNGGTSIIILLLEDQAGHNGASSCAQEKRWPRPLWVGGARYVISFCILQGWIRGGGGQLAQVRN